jgi:hypothetical protein
MDGGVGHDRVVGWVDEFARGFGVPSTQLDPLLRGVRRVLVDAADAGESYDRVAFCRRSDGVEVQLLGSAGVERFLLDL